MSFVIDSIHLNGHIVKNDVLRFLPFFRRVNIRQFERTLRYADATAEYQRVKRRAPFIVSTSSANRPQTRFGRNPDRNRGYQLLT